MINIPEITYKLSSKQNSCCGNKGDYTIYLGLPYNVTKTFNDDEIINYLSDVITHEFLHHVFDYLFRQKEVTFLFDAIGDKLRIYPELNIEMCKLNTCGATPWGIAIKREGIKVLFERYYFLNLDKIQYLLKHGC